MKDESETVDSMGISVTSVSHDCIFRIGAIFMRNMLVRFPSLQQISKMISLYRKLSVHSFGGSTT